MDSAEPWEGDGSTIDVDCCGSALYMFGNVHGFKKGSSLGSKTMQFTTKWKARVPHPPLFGHAHLKKIPGSYSRG